MDREFYIEKEYFDLSDKRITYKIYDNLENRELLYEATYIRTGNPQEDSIEFKRCSDNVVDIEYKTVFEKESNLFSFDILKDDSLIARMSETKRKTTGPKEHEADRVNFIIEVDDSETEENELEIAIDTIENDGRERVYSHGYNHDINRRSRIGDILSAGRVKIVYGELLENILRKERTGLIVTTTTSSNNTLNLIYALIYEVWEHRHLNGENPDAGTIAKDASKSLTNFGGVSDGVMKMNSSTVNSSDIRRMKRSIRKFFK